MTANGLVETVLGPVPVAALGIVLPHEHFPIGQATSEALEPPAAYLPKLELWQRQALNDAQIHGVGAIVEVTPIGSLRMIPMMQRLSRKTGMHVIASTGLYVESRRPAWVQKFSTAGLAEVFVKELTEGIAGTTAKPWMIKVSGGSPQEWSEADRKVFQAGAWASRQTGAAVTTHSCWASKLHFDCLVEAGADPARTYLGHADFDSIEDLTYVARQGGHLIFTCWGIEHFVAQEELTRKILALVDAGLASSVLISIDYAIALSANRMDLISMEYECADRTYGYLFRYAIPKLRSCGITEETIRQFTVDNPRDMLLRPGQAAQQPSPAPRIVIRCENSCLHFTDAAAQDVAQVINSYLAGWPYVRPVDEALFAYWQTLGPAYQPEQMLVAKRGQGPVAFLHGEVDAANKAFLVHLLAVRPGASEEAAGLLAEAEKRARAMGLTRIVGPHYRSGRFYGGYVLGCEPYHPHWAADATEAYVRGGFRISHPGVFMVCDLAAGVATENLPAGYELGAMEPAAEFTARTFCLTALHEGKQIARCGGRLYPQLMTPRGGPAGQIGHVRVEEEHRSKGLSRILVGLAVARLQQWGAAQALIATGLDNYPALRSYERVGFVRRHNINEWSKDLS